MDTGTGPLERLPLLQKLQLPLTYMGFSMLLEAKITKRVTEGSMTLQCDTEEFIQGLGYVMS